MSGKTQSSQSKFAGSHVGSAARTTIGSRGLEITDLGDGRLDCLLHFVTTPKETETKDVKEGLSVEETQIAWASMFKNGENRWVNKCLKVGEYVIDIKVKHARFIKDDEAEG